MKRSLQIENEVAEIDGKIAALYREADANEPINFLYRPSRDQYEENERRRGRCEQISREIDQLRAEAAELRRLHTLAIAEEGQQTSSSPVSDEMAKLNDARSSAFWRLVELQAERVRHARAAAGGDKAALRAMDTARREGEKAWAQVNDLDIARTLQEARDAEDRREFAERGADAKFVAARAVGDEMITAAAKIDTAMKELAGYLGEFDRLARSIRKTGASFDDPRMNSLLTVEVRQRAAKTAGLADFLGVGVAIPLQQASSLEDASRALLRLAIKRPNSKEVAA